MSVLPSPSRRPPRPPLFPYTTLFRSAGEARWQHLAGRGGELRAAEDLHCRVSIDGVVHGEPCLELVERREVGVQDRKSTRLNSSHRCISYAVFCLKKKKI